MLLRKRALILKQTVYQYYMFTEKQRDLLILTPLWQLLFCKAGMYYLLFRKTTWFINSHATVTIGMYRPSFPKAAEQK